MVIQSPPARQLFALSIQPRLQCRSSDTLLSLLCCQRSNWHVRPKKPITTAHEESCFTQSACSNMKYFNGHLLAGKSGTDTQSKMVIWYSCWSLKNDRNHDRSSSIFAHTSSFNCFHRWCWTTTKGMHVCSRRPVNHCESTKCKQTLTATSISCSTHAKARPKITFQHENTWTLSDDDWKVPCTKRLKRDISTTSAVVEIGL